MSDDIKDTQAIIKRTQSSLDVVSKFSSYFLNDHHAYIVRKGERLSSAIHIVTGFIAHDEPVRPLLRSSSLEILRSATDLSRMGGPEAFGARCAEVGVMLQTAESAGLVSAMNAKLILEEYARLGDFVRERYSLISSREHDVSDKKETSAVLQKNKKDSKRTLPVPIKDNKGHMNSRRSQVLNIFTAKDKITIKDVSEMIPDVSEKTLQRELISMVSDRLLIKEGERRWSSYKKA